MKKLIYKDKKNRYLISNHNYLKFILKNIARNKNLSFTLRFNANFKLSSLVKKSYKVKCINRCIITGRKGGINKKFKLSRISLLKFSRFGNISGIKKIVW